MRTKAAAIGVSVFNHEDKLIKNFTNTCGCSLYYYPSHSTSYLYGMMRCNNGKYTDRETGLTFIKNPEIGKMNKCRAYQVKDKRTKKCFRVESTAKLRKFINTNKKFYKDLEIYGCFQNDSYVVRRLKK